MTLILNWQLYHYIIIEHLYGVCSCPSFPHPYDGDALCMSLISYCGTGTSSRQIHRSICRRLGAKGSYLTLVRVADRIL